jgi:Concanavalin A-like lectin/glucanases superfamily
MAFFRGPNVVTNGLVLALDAANTKSYLPSTNLIRNSEISGSAGSSLGSNWYQAQAYGSSVSLSSASFGIDANGLGYTQFDIVGGPSTNTNRFLIDSSDYLNLPSSSTFTFSYNYSLPSSFLSGSNRGIRAQFLFYSASVFQYSSTSPIESGSGLNRASYTFTTTSSFFNSARVRFDFYRDSFAGENVNFTGFRLGGVQLEQQPTATYYILTPLNASSSRTIWTDLSGNNYSGSLVNGPIYSSANNGSFTFNGSNQYVNLSNIPNSNFSLISSSFTTEVWANFITGSDGTLISSDQSTTNGGSYSISVRQNNVYSSFYGTPTYTDVFGGRIITGSWYHFVNTFNYTNQTSSMYFNGVLTGVGSMASSPLITSASLRLGQTYAGSGWFKGSIPSVKVYNRALSSSEVLQNYNALKSRFNLN